MKIYAFFSNSTFGIINNWNECQKISQQHKAIFKKFSNIEDALKWLKLQFNTTPTIFFDSGTGGGDGVEIRLVNEKLENITADAVGIENINQNGNYTTPEGFSNNMGELLALFYALKLANQKNIKQIFGDSMLIIKYWSNGIIKKNDVVTKKIVENVVDLKKVFVENGGKISYISGSENPADLGYHKS